MRLVVAEKPSVARSIAAVLGANEKKTGYMEGNDYIVSWAFGHLIETVNPDVYKPEWKKWNLSDLPIVPEIWQYQIKDGCKEQFCIVKSLMNDSRVTETVCATDAGREGELIYRLIYNKAECHKPIKRLWISSMEDSAIKEGFDNLKPGEDYDNLYDAASCRQKADWLIGLNGTRLFSKAYHSSSPLTVGRVLTPTLNMIVERDSAISRFKKDPFYTVHLIAGGLDAVSDKFKEKAEAEKIESECRGADASVVSVKKEEKTVSPPKLYDLTTLQRDANRMFGYTAKQTLDCVQNLYEKKLCTYPRTDSQYLTDDMEQTALEVITAVLTHILHDEPESFNADIKRVMNSKKVSDHHAIIPTVEIAKQDLSTLPGTELKVLFLIANRMIFATGEKHVYESVKAEIDCKGHIFSATGKTVIADGWKVYEERFRRDFKADKEEEKEDDKALPNLSEGMTFNNADTKLAEGFTQPPKHYTEDSLLSAMERAGAADMSDEVERKGIGTPATRSEIIENLIKYGFVVREKKMLLATESGKKLITVLPDMIKSPNLTVEWENDLVEVAKGNIPADDFMAKIVSALQELVDKYSTPDPEYADWFAPTLPVIGKCPKCGGDIIAGTYNNMFSPYCKEKCGMNLKRVRGVPLTENMLKSLLGGKKILVKGLKSKKGSTYDAYFKPDGIEAYSFTNSEGKEISGFQFKTTLEFPENKKLKK